jgi:hypothetical protein
VIFSAFWGTLMLWGFAWFIWELIIPGLVRFFDWAVRPWSK